MEEYDKWVQDNKPAVILKENWLKSPKNYLGKELTMKIASEKKKINLLRN